MRERLVIVGAGDYGREILSWAWQVPAHLRSWDVGGFLDSRADILDGFELPVKILGSPDTYVFQDNDRVVVAIGDTASRRYFVQLVASRGAQFISIFHPSVQLGLNNTWGVGCAFFPGAVLNTHVTIGDHVTIGFCSVLGDQTVIKSYCTLTGSAVLGGGASLGEGVYLGFHACVAAGVQVGTGAMIGAGSTAINNVEPHTTILGVPGRKLGRARE
jgi:sugar O-acyltransferase (sialic acid O-acetyltransferase NeuD family)